MKTVLHSPFLAKVTSTHLTNCRLILGISIIALLAPFAHAQTTATMVSPANGSTVSGTITISASINGSYGPVVFWRDNWVKLGQSSNPQLSYDTTSLGVGSHQFFVSVLDSAGNTLCASNIVTVTVQNNGVSATMTSPVDGSTVSGTITISASITGSYASVVFWRDNWVQIGQASTPDLSYDTSGLPGGSHQFFISVLDSSGSTLAASNIVTVTVQGGGPLPTPPQNAAYYPNLQKQSSGQWKPCLSDSTQCSGPTESGSGTLLFNISSPSRSGSAMAMTSNGTYFNTMFYNHLGCPSSGCNSVGNMLDDVWFYPASTSNLQQLEFDPDLINGTYAYLGSVACRLIGTNAGHWFLWDETNNNWVATSYPCTASTIAAGTWHHLQLYVTYNTSSRTYTYQTLVFDGNTVFQNLGQTFNALLKPTWTTNTLNVQQQIDNNSNSGASSTVYYDNYNLWAW